MPEDPEYTERVKKLQELRKLGIESYGAYTYDQTDFSADIQQAYSGLAIGEKTKKSVSVAGRIMTKRDMGKVAFFHIQDRQGRVQIHIREEDVGNKQYQLYEHLDLGDIVGIKGIVFRTKKGEVSVFAKELTLLAKALRPLPEKYHGLKDPELRHRRRYVDLIVNPEVRETFVKRAQIITTIRDYLNRHGFLEVETPTLQAIYGGANAKPFVTHLHALHMDLYLRISNELYLKRLIVGGFDRVYEFVKNFRNEGVDSTHNPEFSALEFYCAYIDYNQIMKMTEEIWAEAARKVCGSTKITYQNHKIDLTPPWQRLSMTEAIKKYGDISVDKLSDKELFALQKKYRIPFTGKLTRGTMTQLLFEHLVEDKLIQPVFIIDHPEETTPLCKSHRQKKGLVERLEPYIVGMEVGNGYSELNDPLLQRKLLEKQVERGRGGEEETHPMDEDFIEALEYGLPPTGGMGFGIDRMVMILTNNPSIREVILFPILKPAEQGKA